MKTYSLYLNGKLTITDSNLVVINPADGEPLARMCTVERSTVAQALTDAHSAFKLWRQVPGKKRGELLRQLATELERRRDDGESLSAAACVSS